MSKYELTTNKTTLYDRTVYQIKALKDFGDVKKGDLGGYIEKEANLSQQGNCWVYDEATILRDAILLDDAVMRDYAIITDSVMLSDNVVMMGLTLLGWDIKMSGDILITDKCNNHK